MELKGKTVLVTGAGRGIGKVIATQFATWGAKVSLVSRSDHELGETASEIKKGGGEILFIPGDISDRDQVRLIMEKTIQSFGSIDILVNAAAVQDPIGPLWQGDPSRWAETIRINLLGSFYLCHEVIPKMVEGGRGVAILFSGGGAAYARPNFSAYGVSKTAVLRIVETLFLELKGKGVYVYAIAPGAVKTKMTEQIIEAGQKAGEKAFQEAKGVVQEGGVPPEKAADPCLFLATETPASLSGRLIHVNEPYREYANQLVDTEEQKGAVELQYGLLRRIPFRGSNTHDRCQCVRES